MIASHLDKYCQSFEKNKKGLAASASPSYLHFLQLAAIISSNFLGPIALRHTVSSALLNLFINNFYYTLIIGSFQLQIRHFLIL